MESTILGMRKSFLFAFPAILIALVLAFAIEYVSLVFMNPDMSFTGGLLCEYQSADGIASGDEINRFVPCENASQWFDEIQKTLIGFHILGGILITIPLVFVFFSVLMAFLVGKQNRSVP